MATRFYFPRVNTPPAAFQIDGALNGYWDSERATTTALMVTSKTGFDEEPTAANSWTHTSPAGSDPQKAMFGQWVSPALGAQTISGDIRGVFKSGVITSGRTVRADCRVYVVDSTGAWVATLYAGDTTAAGTTFVLIGTYTTRYYPSAGADTLTSYACANNDRIVVELGCRVHSASSASVGINVGVDTYTDASDSESGTGFITGWFEFANTLSWATAGGSGVGSRVIVGTH